MKSPIGLGIFALNCLLHGVKLGEKNMGFTRFTLPSAFSIMRLQQRAGNPFQFEVIDTYYWERDLTGNDQLST
jgi:hypothetical protein